MRECLKVLSEAFFVSDAMGQAIVVVLGLISLFSLSIIFLKFYSVFVVVRNGCNRFQKRYRATDMSPLAMGVALSDDEEMPLDCVCRAGIDTLIAVLDRSDGRDAVDRLRRSKMLPRPLTAVELDKIRSSMIRQMNSQRIKLDSMMVTLGTIVTLAPFMGLLGTVWGVMTVFFKMGASGGRPNIADMAPGVSSALLTTVVGLLVAIPAVIFNNLISGAIDQTCAEMETFIDDFIADIQLEETVSTAATAQSRPANIVG